MARLLHAGIAVAVLVVFVTDLRPAVPLLAAALLAALALRRAGALAAAIAALLVGSSIAFLLASEVLAWTLALGAGAVAGVGVAAPVSGRGPRGPGRPVAGSSSPGG